VKSLLRNVWSVVGAAEEANDPPMASRAQTFARLEEQVLSLMDGCRKSDLSTAVELLELVLAEIRDQAKIRRPR